MMVIGSASEDPDSGYKGLGKLAVEASEIDRLLTNFFGVSVMLFRRFLMTGPKSTVKK
ncbi:hypothetical protein PM082_000452 [Marasmius tenuissimus]|nr:hypothetical protein PM082_000452 [Marasmius tenuissimus]